ncbi:MAG: DNA polymerase Y family protein [Deltaproteobacteria bacterium]|nr:DNA polymerase Y family protein [Deltaproteobacteria bacterium]
MERLACVDLPAFPLQLLLAKHPDWRGLPSAVVAEDKPQAELLWVSPEARAAGVLPGMRYAQALSLATTLRAAEVSTPEVCAEVDELADLLRGFSPDVEVSREEPGVFWANADGLLSLFSSLECWARKVHGAFAARGRQASVVVGFRRFAAYAVARGQGGVLVLASPEAEEAALWRVPLALLAVEPRLRDTLAKLGIHAMGEFLRLPADAIRRRFGSGAADLHALARGEAPDLLAPVFPPEPIACTILPEVPEGNSLRLLFMVRERLHPLLARLADQGEALRELEVRFFLERRGERTDRIRPADATLEAPLVLELLRLRLEGVPLPAAAAEINLTAHGVPATPEQLQLFLMAQRRDLAAADRSLARIRTELGEEAVVRARLAEGHLPEARFTWEPLSNLERPCPVPQGKPALVRRFYSRPVPLERQAVEKLVPPGWGHLAARCPHPGGVGTSPWSTSSAPAPTKSGEVCSEPEGGPRPDLSGRQGARSWGPYLLSGAWWRSSADQAIRRCYYFLETPEGDRLWVYYDGRRRGWFLHGKVE